MTPKPTSRPPAFISYSETLSTGYHVFVEMPSDTQQSTPLPVVVVVDGDYMFEPLVDAAKKLWRENTIPPALLVGIGYGKPFGDSLNKRGRDYTTSCGEEEPQSGGAQGFLDYLTGPLWAELADRHPMRDDLRVVAGHSLGGLFAVHALFQPKPFFSAALAGAPSLWWDNHRYFGQLERFHKTNPTFSTLTRLFLGIGENDTESMAADLARFERQLAGKPFAGLEVISHTYPRHDHYDLLPALFRGGLQAVLV